MRTNIYKFEVKIQLRNTLIFTGVLCLILMLYLFAIYPAFLNGKEEIMPVFEKFPEAFLDAFGMNMESFFSFIGILSFAYVYIGIVGSIMALTIGLSIFSRETRNKCHDFLIAKPISRKEIFFIKFLAAITLLLMSAIIFTLFAIILYAINGEGEFGTYILILMTFIITQFIFLVIGILLGVLLKRVKSIAAIATGIGIIAFMLSALQGITKIKFLRIISPLQYFSPSFITNNNTIEVFYTIIAFMIIIALPTIAYLRFKKKGF